MRYWFDTEFNENVSPIELISIGIVAQDDRELYIVHSDYAGTPSKRGDSCNAWVKTNVLPILFSTPNEISEAYTVGNDDDIKYDVARFVGQDPYPEFWAYYGAYDWYLLTRLWKNFESLPKNWPNICFDLVQFAKQVGCKNLPEKFKPVHNALIDARWTKAGFEHIKKHWQGVWP